jgi:N-acyl-L-homoserine lactone synthetase
MKAVAGTTTQACSLIHVEERGGSRTQWLLRTDAQFYRAQRLDWNDTNRQASYQRLRGDVFVNQLGWNLKLDPDGSERDRYDIGGGEAITSYGVFGITPQGAEHLLGGVRVFTLRTWDDSMFMHEFSKVGMIPQALRTRLETRFDPSQFIELTRLCVRAGRRYVPTAKYPGQYTAHLEPFDLTLARDLVYGCSYAAAEAAGRRYALAISDSLYLRVMQRSHFKFELLHESRTHTRHGYAVALIDLPATIHAIRSAGAQERADQMLLLCRNPHWVSLWREEESHGGLS